MGRMGHGDRREEKQSRTMTPQAWPGNPHGSVETLQKPEVKTIFIAFKNKNLSSSQECADKEFSRGYMT